MNLVSDLMLLKDATIAPELERILIVDDEPCFRQAYSILLAGEGRMIEECASGTAGIARLARRDIDVVILDLGLPDMDGTEVMDWMGKQCIPTSVVVFSANQSIDSAIHALRRGAFEFIRKQSDPEQVVATVERALRQRRLEKEHAQMTSRLEQSERLHRFLVDQSPDFIYTLDDRGCFVFVNGRVEKLLGFTPEELIGQHYSVIVHEEDVEKARFAFNERRIGMRATNNFEVRLKTRNNEVRHFDNRLIVAILSSQGVYAADAGERNFLGTSGVARDISERKRAEEMIAYQAFHDLLTGLPNRALFIDRLALAVTQSKRRNQKVGVLFVDLDRFKLINDSFGHLEGDRFLQDMANRVKGCLRSGDTLARHGGDEFTLLLPDVDDVQDINVAADKVLEAMRRPFIVAGREFVATASIGMAIFPDHGEAPDVLIRNADIAMYHAKARGKNCCLPFQPSMSQAHTDRIALESELRYAVKHGGQFQLYFQPQIRFSERRVVGLEALIRWCHPTRGFIRPDIFIPIAEETGLIAEVSDWVLMESCALLAKLRELGHTELTLGVNLSAHEFEQDNLIDRIAAPIARYEVPPSVLDIEITEGLLLGDTETVVNQIQHLRRAGVQVSIDDFGTRYSSLNYLRRFPISKLKIDQSFVRDLGVSHGSDAIILAILGVARGFGLEVIAEGVENKAQLDALISFGCDHMQGFLFSKPLPPDALIEFLSGGLEV